MLHRETILCIKTRKNLKNTYLNENQDCYEGLFSIIECKIQAFTIMTFISFTFPPTKINK